jgi:hypothetical protein
MDFVVSLVAIAWCWLVGGALVRLTTARLTALEFHATALLLGLGATGLQLIALASFGLPWHVGTVVALNAPLFAVALGVHLLRQWLRRPARSWGDPAAQRPVRASRDATARLVRAGQVAAVLLAVGLLAVALFEVAIVPSGVGRNPDAYAYYLLKARIFFVDGGIDRYFADQANLIYTVPDHPILIPAVVDWLYLVMGRIDERAAALVSAAFVAGMGALSYAFARRLGVPAVVATVIALLLFVSQSGWVLSVLYLDQPVGTYLLLGAGFTVCWLLEPRLPYAVLGAAGFGLAAWTKNEGAAMYYASVLSLIVVVAGGFVSRRRLVVPLTGFVLLLVVPYLLTIPWASLKAQYGVAVIHLSHLGELDGLGHRLVVDGPRLLVWMGLRAGLAWNVLLLAVVVLFANLLQRSWRGAGPRALLLPAAGSADGVPGAGRARLYVTALLAATLLAYTAAVLASPDPVEDLIKTATGRLVVQATPLFYLLFAALLGTVWPAPAPARPPTAGRPPVTLAGVAAAA